MKIIEKVDYFMIKDSGSAPRYGASIAEASSIRVYEKFFSNRHGQFLVGWFLTWFWMCGKFRKIKYFKLVMMMLH
jgi:hypothetical protein